MEIDGSEAHTGTKSLKIIGINATGTATHSQVRHRRVPIEDRMTYTVAFWAKVDANDRSREVRLNIRTQSDPWAGFFARDIVLDSAEWKEYKISFLAEMVTLGDVWVTLSIAQSDVSFWIDDFRFFQGMPADEFILGDVSGDGEVTPYDAALVLQLAVRAEPPSDAEMRVADMNGNGRIGSSDAMFILRKLAGLLPI